MPCVEMRGKSEGCVGKRQPWSHFLTLQLGSTGQPRSSLMDSVGPSTSTPSLCQEGASPSSPTQEEEAQQAAP